MPESVYPPASPDLARKRRELAPDIQAAFHAFSELVFAEGALPAKTKQLIAVAAYAHSVISLATMNAEQQRHEP